MLIITLNNMKYNFAKPEVTNSDACLTDSLQHKDVKFPFTFFRKTTQRSRSSHRGLGDIVASRNEGNN